jgi:hypothetical protein
LATSKVAALLPEQIQLFYPAVFLLLLPYVIPDGLFISTYSGNMVAPSPEVSAGKIFQLAEIVPGYVYSAFTFDVAGYLGH